LGFPFIFRGALDVRARKITEGMKVAAARALAELAKLDVPEAVSAAYGDEEFTFGPDYIIPKPFDSRVLTHVAPAVAEAAAEDGVARSPLEDVESYRADLERRLSPTRERLRLTYVKAKRQPQRIVFPEGDCRKVLLAAVDLAHEGILEPIVLGPPDEINAIAEEHHIKLDGVTLLRPSHCDQYKHYEELLVELRHRSGVTRRAAQRLIRNRNIFACLMVREGDADGLVTGVTESYARCARPVLQLLRDRQSLAAGVYMLVFKNQVKFLADCSVNIDPNAEQLAEIAILAADYVRRFDVTPRLAMLSFSSFGEVKHPNSNKMRQATALVKEKRSDIQIEGEMQADVAVNGKLRERDFPFSELAEDANVLICPDLGSSNISYKLLQQLAGAEAVGPMLMGIDYAANIAQRSAGVMEIQRLAAITAATAIDLPTSCRRSKDG
ncbi:MAG: NADP-dependent malic enzyme, partial [Deltaproteobacteria bacterium]|nr:NADP-dependent malic enzyme [Deltaproteobacteria bacterium]